MAEQNRLDAVANNIANYSMPGYKKSVATDSVFNSVFHNALSNINTPDDGVKASPLRVDFTQGSMRLTDRALDFAIEGDAFFVVYAGGQPYYTRNGTFHLDPEGNLVTSQGFKVGGDIVLPPDVVMNDISIDPDTGVLRNGDVELGVVETARFEDVHQLERSGPGIFEAPEGVEPEIPATGSKIFNRTLEMSNSEIFTEMTEMIMCMRNFEACQKMIQMQDGAEGQLITRMST